jgi:hypothetical protein
VNIATLVAQHSEAGMAKKFDHERVKLKARGRRDHDYKADAESRRKAAKDEARQVSQRIAKGLKGTGKTARRSGPVTRITGEAAAAIAAKYGAVYSPPGAGE